MALHDDRARDSRLIMCEVESEHFLFRTAFDEAAMADLSPRGLWVSRPHVDVFATIRHVTSPETQRVTEVGLNA